MDGSTEEMKEGYGIYHDVYIEKTADQVFSAITMPEKLILWWPKTCNGYPELNTRYKYYFSPEYDWEAEVVELKVNHRIFFKMVDSDEDWDPTTFGYILIPHKEGTMLQFSHTGWQQRNHAFRRTSFCWAILLKGLKNFLEKGIIIPFPERA